MNEQFLKLSLAIRHLPIDRISDLWSYRYSFFVQSSPRGHNCTYSRMCREKFIELQETKILEKELSKFPSDVAAPIIKILQKINNDHTDKNTKPDS